MTSGRNGASLRLLAGVVVFLAAAPEPAYAYIDPGSGSILLQVIAALGAAFLFMFGWVRGKIRSLFSFGRKDKEKNEQEAED
jgi:hypothetical protein